VQFSRPPSSSGGTDGNQCRWSVASLYDSGGGHSGPVERVYQGRRYRLFTRTCPSGSTLVWVPQTPPAVLASTAASTIYARLPRPVIGTAPPVGAGVVNVGMWFWTDRATWRTVSVTAWVPTPTGILWATTTARPVRLVYTSGDPSGPATVSCTGPGTVWTPAAGDDTVSPCSYTYRHASVTHPSGRFPAALGIEWQISWRSSTGQSGVLPGYTTRVVTAVTVDEIQAIVTG
jgi:hypothetical protein